MSHRRLDAEWQAALLGVGLAVIGWWIHSLLLATMGALVAVTAAVLWVWQRDCLTGVRYRRSLQERRANFGEAVNLDVEVVNDKLLPLTWLHVEDAVPSNLTIQGGTVTTGFRDESATLHQLLPMLPYQRVRRRMTVVCDRRGLHRFGPASIQSSNPAGYQEDERHVPEVDQLLVYPKVFALTPTSPASRLLIGDHRSQRRLIGDPTRVVGVRAYQPGDPLRHIDWRATARSDSLLVRVFEPTTSPLVAVVADFGMPRSYRDTTASRSEFAIAVTASFVSDLAARKVPVGLYATGEAAGLAVARPPSASPDALTEMLELLARVTQYAPTSLADLLLGAAGRLRQGTSLVVVGTDFSGRAAVALAELRRRYALTAVWIETEGGSPPAPALVDAAWMVRYRDDWAAQDSLELASAAGGGSR